MDRPIELFAGMEAYFVASCVVAGTFTEITVDAKKVAESLVLGFSYEYACNRHYRIFLQLGACICRM